MSVYPQAVRDEAVRLRAQGLSYERIGQALGVSTTTACRWLNPEYADSTRRLAREAKRRRTGVCRECGAETRYNGRTVNGSSELCVSCNGKRQGAANLVWTRERIIAAIQDAARVLGHTPGYVDFNPHYARNLLHDQERALRSEQMIAAGRWPWSKTIYDRFGSYRAACDAAGFTPHEPYGTAETARRRRSAA